MRKMTRSKMATQPYKYIGKELDRTHGLDWYDHGARHYAPMMEGTEKVPFFYDQNGKCLRFVTSLSANRLK